MGPFQAYAFVAIDSALSFIFPFLDPIDFRKNSAYHFSANFSQLYPSAMSRRSSNLKNLLSPFAVKTKINH